MKYWVKEGVSERAKVLAGFVGLEMGGSGICFQALGWMECLLVRDTRGIYETMFVSLNLSRFERWAG